MHTTGILRKDKGSGNKMQGSRCDSSMTSYMTLSPNNCFKAFDIKNRNGNARVEGFCENK